MKRLHFFLYWLTTTVILLEVAVRIWGYAEHYIYDPIYEPYLQAKDIPFVHKANLHEAQGRGLTLLNTDSLGLRSLESGTVYGSKQPNEIRIVILGDSITFGEGIPQTANTYPQLVATMLQERLSTQQIRVFNFGVSAYSVRTMVATFQHRALALQPNFVIMAVAPQDFALERTGEVDRWGYNVREVDNGRFPLLSLLKRSLRSLHLTYLIRDVIVRWRIGSPTVPSDWALPDTYRYLPQFQTLANQHNIPNLILLLPTRSRQSFQALPNQLAQDGLPTLNLLDLGSDLPDEQFQASAFDGHPSAQVHRLIAEELVGYLETAVYRSNN